MTHFTPYPLITTSTIPMPTIVSTPILQPSLLNPIMPQLLSPMTPQLLSPMMQPAFIPVYPNTVSYQDVNNDRNLKAQVVEYFYNKILKNWLKFHYTDLFHLLTVSDGKVVLTKNVNDTENNIKNNDIKYEYLVDNFFRKKDILQLLSKFRKINSLNWWDLKQHSDKVRMYVHHKVKQYMKQDTEN